MTHKLNLEVRYRVYSLIMATVQVIQRHYGSSTVSSLYLTTVFDVKKETNRLNLWLQTHFDITTVLMFYFFYNTYIAVYFYFKNSLEPSVGGTYDLPSIVEEMVEWMEGAKLTLVCRLHVLRAPYIALYESRTLKSYQFYIERISCYG